MHETREIQPDPASSTAGESPDSRPVGTSIHETPQPQSEPATSIGSETLTPDELRASINRITRALASASDDDLPALIGERSELRTQLREAEYALLPDNVRPIETARQGKP
jgi:hypothetical protein